MTAPSPKRTARLAAQHQPDRLARYARHHYQHRAEIEAVVQGADRDAAFDTRLDLNQDAERTLDSLPGLAFVAEMRSMAHVLQQTVGRVYQAACDARLGDGRCKVNLDAAALRGTGAVTDLVRARAFVASGLAAFEDRWFALGTMTWTSGANTGRRAEVLFHEKVASVVTITLLEKPVRAIAVGDAFTIRAGCDKRIATCHAKFANTANFRGFPHIPGQDTIPCYATKDGGHDGGVL